MSNPQEKQPRKDERNEVTVNLGAFGVGLVLTACLIWSIYTQTMEFAYLNVGLLFGLAVFNHAINMIYQ